MLVLVMELVLVAVVGMHTDDSETDNSSKGSNSYKKENIKVEKTSMEKSRGNSHIIQFTTLYYYNTL